MLPSSRPLFLLLALAVGSVILAPHVARSAPDGVPLLATPQAAAAGTRRAYLPLVTRARPAPVIRVAFEVRNVGSISEDPAQAVAGTFPLPSTEGFFVDFRPNDGFGLTIIGRSYLVADVPAIPAGTRVAAAALELVEPCAVADQLPWMILHFHPGTWPGRWTGDQAAVWSAFDPRVVATLDTSPYPKINGHCQVSGQIITLPIDPALVTPGEPLKLVARDPEDVDAVAWRSRYERAVRHISLYGGVRLALTVAPAR